MDYEAYVALKQKKAVEQGHKWWYEAVLTDSEAHLRVTSEKHHTCNWYKYYDDKKKVCQLDHNLSEKDIRIITCDEWRYVG